MREVASDTLTWLRDLPRGLPQAVVRSAVASVLVEVEFQTERDADGKPVKVLKERHRKAELPPVDSFYFDDIRLVMRAMRAGNGGLVPRFLVGTTERIRLHGPGLRRRTVHRLHAPSRPVAIGA